MQKCFRKGTNFTLNKIIASTTVSQIVSVSGTQNSRCGDLQPDKAARLSKSTVILTERQGN